MGVGDVIVGIDGGATGCRVVLRVNGRVFFAQGGPANATTDISGAADHICAALETAATAAGLASAELDCARVHAGLAGVKDDEVAQALAARLPGAHVRVTEDRETVLRGALGGADGAVLAVGTGSFVAVAKQGAVRFAGGWGLHLSDDASGAWLGREATREMVMAADGLRAQTGLTLRLLDHFNGRIMDAVIFARDRGPQDFAALAPMVIEAAEEGDAVAVGLMRSGAAWLAAAVDALDGTDLPVHWSGSVAPRYAAYLPFDLVPPKGSALDGALWLAEDGDRMEGTR